MLPFIIDVQERYKQQTKIDMPNLTIPTKDGKSFNSYISFPKNLGEGEAAPCVIMIQEIFGVNKVMRDKCDWLSDHGFIACAPDLFHQFEAGIELNDQIPDELQRAFDYFGKFDIDQGIKDIKATQHVLRAHAQSNGKVGAVGYCLGGKLAYLTSCHSDIDCSIGYYGVGIEGILAQANTISSPLMLHIAQKDGFVPPEAQKQIHNALQDNPNTTLHSYADVDHAFAREGGDHYDEKASDLANERTLSFLTQHLKGC